MEEVQDVVQETRNTHGHTATEEQAVIQIHLTINVFYKIEHLSGRPQGPSLSRSFFSIGAEPFCVVSAGPREFRSSDAFVTPFPIAGGSFPPSSQAKLTFATAL